MITNEFVGPPNLAFYTPEGDWEIENKGVAPDFEVELDPKLWRQGHDAQLEKAVQVVLDLLEKHPTPPHKRPPFPNYHTKEK
jgi:tricorn protease